VRGHIRERYKDIWNIIIVPDSGLQKRVQKRVTVKGTKRDAARKLTELLYHLHRGGSVGPSKWLSTLAHDLGAASYPLA
jgi:hypothetical protein